MNFYVAIDEQYIRKNAEEVRGSIVDIKSAKWRITADVVQDIHWFTARPYVLMWWKWPTVCRKIQGTYRNPLAKSGRVGTEHSIQQSPVIDHVIVLLLLSGVDNFHWSSLEQKNQLNQRWGKYFCISWTNSLRDAPNPSICWYIAVSLTTISAPAAEPGVLKFIGDDMGTLVNGLDRSRVICNYSIIMSLSIKEGQYSPHPRFAAKLTLALVSNM